MSGVNDAIVFLRFILAQLCKESDEVVVDVDKDDRGTVIVVRVAGTDMGKLIGKKGQNISAIRTLVRVMGAREGEKVSLKVVEIGS